ncbi:DNA polymerase III subunit gamma/tau [Bifidobacterium xylocopae]|uniref:DNA-directed DNA polymerase n=1 Tax=Bifidobacterium xylocopae TaxID=2493119 RepID=A0A366KCI2_9BIFI|nr:DNA polymerase III subunit gamma/tau [Bifidobacterium xylocopae]RBP99446.1 DNA polymerase III, subunit gamma and tau [Bifidobacterium xylocopae]
MALALYRRYRPDTFDGVIGQKQVTVPLSRALDGGKLTHAYLFSGPRGCGKTSSARIFARGINCVKGPTSHPCGECDSCRDLATGGPGSIDVVEIDAASHNGVDDARELRERAGFAPVRDRYKIFILDEAHMVTQQGFNALLKIVEEPPEHVMFIFATTEPEKVISTIRSRTHHYPFRLVPQEVMGPYLEQICKDEKIETEPGVLKLAMRAGGGSVRDTLSVLDQLMVGADEGTISYDSAVALLGYTPEALIGDAFDAMIDRDGPKLYDVIQKVLVGGFEPKRFVEDLLQRARDLIVMDLAGQRAESVLKDDAGAENPGDLKRQAQALGMGRLTRIADILDEGLASMSGAISPRMRLELLAARLLVPDSGAAPAAGAGVSSAHGASSSGTPARRGFIAAGKVGSAGANRPVSSQPAAPVQTGAQSQQEVPKQTAVGPTPSASMGAEEQAAVSGRPPASAAEEQDGRSVDQRWDAVVKGLPDGVKEYVGRDKVPTVALGRNAKGRAVLSMTFDQPLSQHAFALAVASQTVDGENKVPKIVMLRARQEFGADTMIAPSGVAANGEKVESVARMSPERRSEVKKQIALARANLSALNLGAGVAPHTASDQTGQSRARSPQHSGDGASGTAESAGDASDSDDHHADPSGPAFEQQDTVRSTAPAESDVDAPATGAPVEDASPLPAAGFASTESYVKPDDLDDNDPWAHPTPQTVNLGPQPGAEGRQSEAQEEAAAERKVRKMGLPDLSDGEDPWAHPQAPTGQGRPPQGGSAVDTAAADIGAGTVADRTAADTRTVQERQSQARVTEGPAVRTQPMEDDTASQAPEVDNGGFGPASTEPARPEVPPEDDEYSLDDARQGEDSLMGPKELAQMFDVKQVEDLAADNPENPLNAGRRKRQQGFDE